MQGVSLSKKVLWHLLPVGTALRFVMMTFRLRSMMATMSGMASNMVCRRAWLSSKPPLRRSR